MIVTKMVKEDADAFIDTAKCFFDESRNSALRPDIEKFRSIVLKAIKHPDHVVILLAKENGKVLGYAILNTYQDYTVDPLGDMYQFYVHPAHRGKGVSRELAEAIISQFDAWGCPISHISADTGIDDGLTTQLFHNLFAKVGYKQTGIIMTRTRGDQNG